MPANNNQFHHHHHHHEIPNPNPNSNSNSNPNPSQPAPPPPKPTPQLLSLLLKSIIMVLIISLFFLFLGIAAVAVIHFFLAGGVLHRHRLRRRSNTQFPVDSFATSAAGYSAEDLQRCLPRLKYDARLPGTAWVDCAVCLDCFKDGDWCLTLPDCHHMFHASCVDKWLTKVPNCPICRSTVRLNSEATGSMIGDDHCKLLWAIGV
ncbi:hypothetical protein ACSBR1_025947 [Camellia fascicularis]